MENLIFKIHRSSLSKWSQWDLVLRRVCKRMKKRTLRSVLNTIKEKRKHCDSVYPVITSIKKQSLNMDIESIVPKMKIDYLRKRWELFINSESIFVLPYR